MYGTQHPNNANVHLEDMEITVFNVQLQDIGIKNKTVVFVQHQELFGMLEIHLVFVQLDFMDLTARLAQLQDIGTKN